MTKTQILLLSLTTVVGAIVLYANRDWFSQGPIQISHRFEGSGGRFAQDVGTVPLLFEFNRQLKLKSLKIFRVNDLGPNKSPRPVWSLSSHSGSAPTRGFMYGIVVPGMQADPPDAGGTALDPGVTYRLMVEAGSTKAQHDFILEAAGP